MLNLDQLPPLFKSADRTALRAERRYLGLTYVSLLLLVVAALFGSFTIVIGARDTDWSGVVCLVAFVLTIIIRSFLLRTRPDRDWYEGRAAAESVKTLAWRYSVAGNPFPVGLDHSDDIFAARVAETLTDLDAIDLEPAAQDSQITDEMRRLRALPFTERKTAYRTGRIGDQRRWYAEKSEHHRNRASQATYAVLFFEAAGAIGALVRALAISDIDVLGLTAAIGAALIAVEQATQNSTLSKAYAIASQELASIGSVIESRATEADWAVFVDDAEEAISREHQLWRASRGLRDQVR